VISGGTSTNLGNGEFMGMVSGSGTTEAPFQTPLPVAGTVKNFYVKANVVVGGTSIVYTVRKNGAATSVTCTMTSAQSTCNDTTNTAGFSAGDLLSIATVKTGGTTQTPTRWSAQYGP
jgi:hypothetical protein